jgi:hypothetical protein
MHELAETPRVRLVLMPRVARSHPHRAAAGTRCSSRTANEAPLMRTV